MTDPSILNISVYPQDFNFIDPDCAAISEYLFTEINELFYSAINDNIIKSYRPFNDNFVPLMDFPLLKVYKTSETSLDFLSNLFESTFKVSYALAYIQQPKVSDVTSIVAKEIAKLLKIYSFREGGQVSHNQNITIEYEDFIDPDNTIYTYATITFAMVTTHAVSPINV